MHIQQAKGNYLKFGIYKEPHSPSGFTHPINEELKIVQRYLKLYCEHETINQTNTQSTLSLIMT